MLADIIITPAHWAGFIVCILFLLALDLGVFHRSSHVVRFREAIGWTTVWFCIAMGFAAFLYRFHDHEKAALFITGYIVEVSLSMDNVFVIAVIFRYFKVPAQFQHRVLFWGILGALVMRGALIAAGTVLVQRFEWLLYVLGALLIITGIKMLFSGDDGVHPEKNPIIRLARRFFPVSLEYDGQRFLTPWRGGDSTVDRGANPSTQPGGRALSYPLGALALTPLAIVLIMVETTDLVFAMDSLPAIFGITQDAFIIFTSNVFAILGLRSLYFALAEAIEYFVYLKYGLSVVLIFIGSKMVAKPWIELPTNLALVIVAGIILTSVLVSVLMAKLHHRKS